MATSEYAVAPVPGGKSRSESEETASERAWWVAWRSRSSASSLSLADCCTPYTPAACCSVNGSACRAII
uniref:Uncharacterized protein n=1 Tax=Oryza rufipogon TaxID=4529 RepID=A0A0E0NB54_ORYRU